MNASQKIERLVPKAIQALEDTVGQTVKLGSTHTITNDPKVRIHAAREILNRGGITGNDEKQKGAVTIQLYAPGWATESGKGEIIEIQGATE